MTKSDDPADTTGTLIFQRRLRDWIWSWFLGHWWQLLLGIGSLVTGISTAVGAYLYFTNAVSDAHSAKRQVDGLYARLASIDSKLDILNAQAAALKQWQDDHPSLPRDSDVDAAMKLGPHHKGNTAKKP
jgi:hypothetical protein